MRRNTDMSLLRLYRQVATPEVWRRRLAFWIGAIATGSAAVLFAEAGNLMMRGFAAARLQWPWAPYLICPVGLAIAAWLTRTAFPGAEGSGIPQAIATISIPLESARDRLLSIRIAVGKIVLTLVALASGASVGREGPTVQVGASIMHALRRVARFKVADVDRGLILAGGAAGVAAAFNTPLAGVVFAIEELARNFEERTSGTILLAVIVAGMTSIAMVGNYTYFGSTSAVLTFAQMAVAVPVCGIVGGLAGGIFSRAIIVTAQQLPVPVAAFRRRFPELVALGCGLGLAVLGTLSHATTFGTGYQEARGLLEQSGPGIAGFALYKGLATLLSYFSGVPGGIFAPSLAVGAGLGAEISAWLPSQPGGAIVLLSMAAYFAGVVQAPLTALVIVTEMTGNRELMLPLMAVVLLARAASGLVCRRPVYRALAEPLLERWVPKAGEPQTGESVR